MFRFTVAVKKSKVLWISYEQRSVVVSRRRGSLRALKEEVKAMQLPDEAIAYDYKNLLANPLDEWTPVAELRAQHFLAPEALQELTPRVLQVRSQVATERELKQIPPKMQPLQGGFINLPQNLLDQHKRQNDASTLGK